MERLRIKIEQLPEAADLPLPKYMSNQAAGMDLYACVTEDVVLNKGDINLIPTGIKIALIEGFEAQIRPRSGLALKHGITLLNTPGTIDADYRGEIKIIMINVIDKPFVIKRGERLAQMVINKVEMIDWELVDSVDISDRGDGGFGHTGK
ncbi:MAG: dUTP diphosphatase [Vallitaleaceae bacterium]|jgi:dUTP pyrophosphatase|nr:dUTP diphosphatase [Vallitaleaceae bacterium]